MGKEREVAEEAFAALNSKVKRPWPGVAARISDARRRCSLTQAHVAEQVGITRDSYHDLEADDGEAFTGLSLAELARLAGVLGVSLRMLLLADESPAAVGTNVFDEISKRLRERASTECLSVDEFGEKLGWDVSGVLAKPEALWEFNLVGWRDVCLAVGADWAAVLPDESMAPPVDKRSRPSTFEAE